MTKYAKAPKYAELTDQELVQKARDIITERAYEIAALTGHGKARVEHGLWGYRWPKNSVGVDGLCDLLAESLMILEAVRGGANLDAAAGAVVMARGMKVHGGVLPKLTPPPAYPGDK